MIIKIACLVPIFYDKFVGLYFEHILKMMNSKLSHHNPVFCISENWVFIDSQALKFFKGFFILLDLSIFQEFYLRQHQFDFKFHSECSFSS